MHRCTANQAAAINGLNLIANSFRINDLKSIDSEHAPVSPGHIWSNCTCVIIASTKAIYIDV